MTRRYLCPAAFVTHLLLTNDYPPKVGGIQSYLWELWRRLPGDSFSVLTSPHPAAAEFDVIQHHHIERYDRFWLPPSRRVLRRARAAIAASSADCAVVDPAWPLGWIAPELGVPYAAILHGAEVSVPARIPGARRMLARTIEGASLIISASRFAEAEARRIAAVPKSVYVPPGVDTRRFVPLGPDQRRSARRRLGLDPDGPLIVGVSRLVRRKGFDVLIEAAARLGSAHPDLQVVIAGTGRDESRLKRLIGASGAPVHMLGFVADDDLPALYACADAFAMLCSERWWGLEQEGFGIVFVEAAAAGTPQIAGRSGGSSEAVADGETGWIVDEPTDPEAAARAIDEAIRRRHDETMRDACRQHAETNFDYDLLAARLADALAGLGNPSLPGPT